MSLAQDKQERRAPLRPFKLDTLRKKKKTFIIISSLIHQADKSHNYLAMFFLKMYLNFEKKDDLML